MKFAGTLDVLRAVVLWSLVSAGGGLALVAEVVSAEETPISTREAETIVAEEEVLPEELCPTVAIKPMALLSLLLVRLTNRGLVR